MAYQKVPAFAYPGWRLTVPGGPAGGHYKGFTHTQAAGTTILPEDEYELDRGDGMSSHDAVHASPRNPRGVYRSSGEVPPRPNASGAAHTYRGFQTRRHAGTSVAPGSFPADYFETGEDDFLSLATNAPHFLKPMDVASQLFGLGAVPLYNGHMGPVSIGPIRAIFNPIAPGPAQVWTPPPAQPPNTVANPTPPPPTPITPNAGPIVVAAPCEAAAPPAGMRWQGDPCNGGTLVPINPPQTGATSVVNQPPATPAPAPPSPSIPVVTAPPVSPAPAPVVATNEVVPLQDGSGNYVNISTGAIIPASQVTQNLATMQLTTASAVAGQLIPLTDGSGNYLNPQTGAIIPGAAISQSAAATSLVPASAMTWLEQPSSLFPSIPNWGLLAGAAVAAAMLMGKRR